MGNKRVSQLVALTPSEVVSDDLLLIIDSSAKESKKITISNISAYLNVSASITAYSAIFADTASYVLGSNVRGLVESASYSLRSTTASMAHNASEAITSSYAKTASFVSGFSGSLTASYLQLLPGAENGTASYAQTASFVNLAKTSSFLLHTPGVNNGTASHALKADSVNGTILNSDTASFLRYTGISNGTASHAMRTNLAISSSYLIYSPNNGTASYAILAGGYASNTMRDYGIFLAMTQSNFKSSLDSVSILPSMGGLSQTPIEAVGTAKLNYTSSIPLNETLSLIAQFRNTGVKTTLDSTPIVMNISPVIGDWDAYSSGTISIPFSLMGQADLSGSYMVYVTGSPNLVIDSLRTVRFNISSKSDIVSVSSYEPLEFSISPYFAVATFSSSTAGPFSDTAANIVLSGSSNVSVVNVRNNPFGITDVRYIWSLTNLRELDCSQNPMLYLRGMPSTLQSLTCESCSLVEISSLSNLSKLVYFNCNNNSLSSLPNVPTSSAASVTASYLDCSNNVLTSLPSLPNTMSHLDCSDNLLTSLPSLPLSLSYLDCSKNNIVSLPSFLPTGLKTLYCNNNTTLTTLPLMFPDTITSMSFAGNTSLTSWSTALPESMSYLNCSGSPVQSMSPLPTGSIYINLYGCNLGVLAIDAICSKSLANGLLNGYLNIANNNVPLVSTETDYINPLIVNGWTVLYDL